MLYVTFNALKSSLNVDHLSPSIDFGEVLKINQYRLSSSLQMNKCILCAKVM